MEFIDLKAQQNRIRSLIEKRIQEVLNHGRYIMGPEVEELEETLARYVGAKYAVGCASGTDALLLALMAYDLRPGDAVFTPAFTFVATVEVISLLGAVPIFVDIDPCTFNIDPSRLEQAIEALESNDPSRHPLPSVSAGRKLTAKGIIAVDLFGLPADYNRINEIAGRRGLFVIEDGAQSFGAEYFGRKACNLAEVACTSFFPAKPLGAYGDGGMCFTDDEQLAGKLRSLRLHGQGRNKYDHVRIGLNGRLDTIQAAILLAKFEIFPEEVQFRQQVAAAYSRLLDGDSSPVATPKIPDGFLSAWAQYSVLARNAEERSELRARLQAAGIPTAIHYPIPLHLQPALADLGYRKGDFPVSEECAGRIFSLPMHPYLRREEQERIAHLLLQKTG